jgi:hypothetical protein
LGTDRESVGLEYFLKQFVQARLDKWAPATAYQVDPFLVRVNRQDFMPRTRKYNTERQSDMSGSAHYANSHDPLTLIQLSKRLSAVCVANLSVVSDTGTIVKL